MTINKRYMPQMMMIDGYRRVGHEERSNDGWGVYFLLPGPWILLAQRMNRAYLDSRDR